MQKRFPERLISLRGDIQWSARSSDLVLRDHFLRGYLKTLVYVNRPETLGQLKDKIRDTIFDIGRHNMLRKVDRSFKIRISKCIDDEGVHLRDAIFKTLWNKTLNTLLYIGKKIKSILLILFVLWIFKIRKWPRLALYMQLINKWVKCYEVRYLFLKKKIFDPIIVYTLLRFSCGV